MYYLEFTPNNLTNLFDLWNPIEPSRRYTGIRAFQAFRGIWKFGSTSPQKWIAFDQENGYLGDDVYGDAYIMFLHTTAFTGSLNEAGAGRSLDAMRHEEVLCSRL